MGRLNYREAILPAQNRRSRALRLASNSANQNAEQLSQNLNRDKCVINRQLLNNPFGDFLLRAVADSFCVDQKVRIECQSQSLIPAIEFVSCPTADLDNGLAAQPLEQTSLRRLPLFRFRVYRGNARDWPSVAGYDVGAAFADFPEELGEVAVGIGCGNWLFHGDVLSSYINYFCWVGQVIALSG